MCNEINTYITAVRQLRNMREKQVDTAHNLTYSIAYFSDDGRSGWFHISNITPHSSSAGYGADQVIQLLVSLQERNTSNSELDYFTVLLNTQQDAKVIEWADSQGFPRVSPDEATTIIKVWL